MCPTTLRALADRLERMTSADTWNSSHVLMCANADIANHFLPKQEGTWLAVDNPFCNDYGDEVAADYTTSMDAIINLIPDHATWLRDVNHEGKLTMRVCWADVSGEGSGATPALELCVAFLRACAETYA